MNPIYKGLKLVHNIESVPMIKRVIKEFNPELIMEIGTAHGGLTLVFHEAAPQAELHTYDPFRNVNTRLFGKNVHFHKADAFKSNLYDLCKNKKRKFLFCDGFDKKKEMLTFGPLLNSGDMLGCHDYPTRLWKDWKRGKRPTQMEQVIHPDIEKLLEDFEPLKANKLFEEKQGKDIYSNKFSDRYWIKK
jgi:cephalosporin hydroxylase